MPCAEIAHFLKLFFCVPQYHSVLISFAPVGSHAFVINKVFLPGADGCWHSNTTGNIFNSRHVGAVKTHGNMLAYMELE